MNLPTVSQLPCDSESEDETPPNTPLQLKTKKYKLKSPEQHSSTTSPKPNSPSGCGYIYGFCEDKNPMHRRTMEDTHVMKENFAGRSGQGFFAVFDGHAGKQAAQWCGNHVHELLEYLLTTQPDTPIPDLLNETFVTADNRLAEKQIYSGCTVVASFIQLIDNRRVLHTANAGDARAVLCRKGKAIRLTYDHKGSDKNEATRITKAGGLVLNDRVNGVLAVTRSLGDCSMKSLVVGNPYTTSLELELDDEFLILACDGVWDVLSDQEAVNLIRKIEDPQAAASFLVQKSLENLSTDNLSVIVIRFLRNFFTSNSISKRDPDSDIEAEVNEESGGQTPTPSSVSLVFGRIGADERK